jgi:hypothetical protein
MIDSYSQFRQERCKKEDGSPDGLRRMKTVLTDTWVAIGRQEKRTIGMESLIYLDKVVICLHVLKRMYPTEH